MPENDCAAEGSQSDSGSSTDLVKKSAIEANISAREAKRKAYFQKVRRSYGEYKRDHPQGRLCRRCARVNWPFLLTSEASHSGYSVELFRVPESSEELSAACCPLCLLLSSDHVFDKSANRALYLDCACSIFGPRCWYPNDSDTDDNGRGPTQDWKPHAPRLVMKQRHGERNVVAEYILQHAHAGTQSYRIRKLAPEVIDYKILRRWIRHCEHHHHTRCKPILNPCIPGLRVMDCNTGKVVAAPKNTHFRYIALSYVWGGVKATETEQANLPATIRDAITLTRGLGRRYLWVDQLCIDQSDESHKQAQLELMGRIYAESELVVIAAAGSSSHYGLPGVSTKPRQRQRRIELDTDVDLIKSIDATSKLANSTWAMRGWTFQEGYLATRRLVFTDNEIIFVCDRGVWQESVQRPGIKDSLNYVECSYVGFPTAAMSRTLLPQTLEYYSARVLSFEGDVVKACIGILENCIAVHFWGMWDIPSGGSSPSTFSFNWRSRYPGQRRIGFPTWSWVTTTGPKHIPVRRTRCCWDWVQLRILTTDGNWLIPEDHTESRYDPLPARAGPTLQLTGSFCPASLGTTPKSSKLQEYGAPYERERGETPLVVFQHTDEAGDEIETALELCLDVQLTGFIAVGAVKAVLVADSTDRFFERCADDPPVFMILQAVGDHYKRIGITGPCSWIREKKTLLQRESLRGATTFLEGEREIIYVE